MKSAPLIRMVMPSFQTMVWITVFIAVIGFGPRLLNMDGDLGRHLTLGQLILETRSIPLVDMVSHTKFGEPLTPHEWLSQVLFALAYRLLGLDGVVLLVGIVIATVFYFVYRQCALGSRGLIVPFTITLLAMAASSIHWLSRPHIFTFLMLVIWTDGLYRLRLGDLKTWWLLPLVMLLWVNLHGAFIAGFFVWAVYLVGYLLDGWLGSKYDDPIHEKRFGSRLMYVGGASFVLSLVNPAGIYLWSTSLGYIQNRYLVSHTAEYLPPDFQAISASPFLLMIILSLVVLGLRNKRLSIRSILLLAGWTAMALYSTRNIPLYAIIAAPILSGTLSKIVDGKSIRISVIEKFRNFDHRIADIQRQVKGFIWIPVVILLAGVLLWNGFRLDFSRSGNRFFPEVFPEQAVDWLVMHPQPGNVFNEFTWGGYLLYRQYPGMKVFIDGQTDFYGEALTREYEQVITLRPGWEKVFQKYQILWVIFPHGAPIFRGLSTLPGWKCVYQDATAEIWVFHP
ncbi:MAG TPA: hypothetical protein VIO61_10460 [Anaerolineaceae bacterium]